jgi:hypothetical protein
MVQNIISVYESADEDNIERGHNWYAETLKYCTMAAEMLGYEPQHAVGAYAVISPSLDKEQNDKQFVKGLVAHRMGIDIREVKIGVYGEKNRVKFGRCLEGDLTAVSGPKVTSFYNNIMGNPDHVTVDRWAVRIALGVPDLPEKKSVPSSKGCYNAIQAAFVDAAERLGNTPHRVQARTWEVWRGKYYRRSADDYKKTRG